MSSDLYKIRQWQRRLDTMRRNAEELNHQIIERYGVDGAADGCGDVMSDFSDDIINVIDGLGHVLDIAASHANQKPRKEK